MTPDESSLQELATRLAHEKQLNAALHAKLTSMQAELASQQISPSLLKEAKEGFNSPTSPTTQSNQQQAHVPDPSKTPASSSPAINTSATHPPKSETGSGLAIASLILGIISLVFWIFYGVGGITAIVGIILSAFGRRSISHRGMATAGLITSIIALVLSLGFCSLLVYFAAHIGHSN